MEFFRNTNIKFLKYKFVAFAVSGAIILSGLIYIKQKGINYGIDFVGGTLLQIKFKEPVKIDELRKKMKTIGFADARIQAVENLEDEYLIRVERIAKKVQATAEEEYLVVARKIERALMSEEEKKQLNEGKLNLNTISFEELKNLLLKKFPEQQAQTYASRILEFRKQNKIIHSFEELAKLEIPKSAIDELKKSTFIGSFSTLRVEVVGPQVGKTLRHKATLATVWALFGMLLYIAFRFRPLYGISAVLTLFHDVLVVLAFIAFLQIEFSLPVVAAILTIVGYSINDTIVIFDRVRENLPLLRRKKEQDFEELLNKSINQTLSRTILTSGTTLLALLSLYLLGGAVIKGFALTLLIGIIVGTYSSIYQSCAYLALWNKAYGLKGLMKK